MDLAKLFAGLRPLMPYKKLTTEQVERIEPLVHGIESRLLMLREAAYILATAFWESDRFQTMEEYWGPTKAQKGYEGRKDLGNVIAGDGRRFLGRGYCQITGRRNYADWGKRLGVDFLKEPQLVSKPEYAVKIIIEGMMLGTFTGKRLSDYITASKADYVGARRIINGQDKAEDIATIARKMERVLVDAGYGALPSCAA